MKNEIVIEVWGDLACFSRPEGKVERLTYPVPTPSAMRGLLSAIYSKPNEFYWQVNSIEVLKPLRYASFKRNEVKKTLSKNPILVEADDTRTQRQTIALQDVRYRVTAAIVKRSSFSGTELQLYEQALRRIRGGKCYFQPSLGCREFVAYFEESDGTRKPEPLNLDLGYMLYDVFDLHKYEVTLKAKPFVSVFHAQLKKGVLTVPPYDSAEVLKPEEV
jgi:CRISPR-associated protein Cas5d